MPDPAWACLDGNAATPGTGNTFTVRVPLVDVAKQPAPGIIAKLYRKIDVDAATQIGETFFSDGNGILTLNISAKFDGYLVLASDESSTDPIVPSFYFFDVPIERDETVFPVRLSTLSSAAALLSSVGKAFDSTRGIVILTAQDCTAKPAAGVNYTFTPGNDQAQAFYSKDGLPTIATSATDASGYGGLIGLLPGTVIITGSEQSQGTMGQLSLFTKASHISYSRMVPRAQH